MLEKIQKLEQETEKLKNELNDLINEQQNQPSSDLINHKINALKNQLYYIGKQIEILQNPQATTVKTQVQQKQPATKQINQLTPKVIQKEKKNLEATLGKNVMAIAASILIFISLIFFGTLLVPYLTDAIKMVLMFFVSFAFTTLGLTFLQKDKSNKWFLSISGCGMGAIYISLIVSFVYFNAFNYIILYIFIAIWAIATAILSKTKSQLFEIIGQIGILISVFWGVMNSNIDNAKFTFLVVYFIITTIIFTLSNVQKEYHKNLIINIFNTISIFILMFGSINFSENKLVAIILPFYLIALISLKFIYNRIEKTTSFILTISMDYTVLYFLLMNFVENIFKFDIRKMEITMGIIGLIYSIIIFVLYEIKLKETKNSIKIIPDIGCIILLLASAINFMEKDLELLNIFLPIIAITLLFYGFKKCNKSNKIYAITLIVFTFFTVNEILQFFYIIAFIGTFIYLIIKNNDYSQIFKNILYIITIISVNILFNPITDNGRYMLHDLQSICKLTTMLILSVVFCKLLTINPFTKEKENDSRIIGYIVNVILMITVTGLIGSTDGIYKFLAILIAIALYSINIKNIFENFAQNLAGIYICLKYTILIFAILNSIDAANFIIDIVFFIIAIVCIIIGFYKNYKSFRYYGLVLSLTSVIKLTLIDVTYSNSIGRAFSFFICGILCFVISLIYNKIDKNFKNK